MRYQLTGRFIECCNCKVVCPCWVDDTPTEDHCTGFFAWTFFDGSEIDGHSVAGQHVVVVTVHSDPNRGGTSESVLFVEKDLDDVVAAALTRAFAWDDPGRTDPLGDLRTVLGYPVARKRATIRVEEVEQTLEHAESRATGLGRRALRRVQRVRARYPLQGYRVRVSVPSATVSEDEPLVETTIFPEYFDESGQPLSLTSTALDHELRTQGVVTAHRTEQLLIRVAALAGAGTEITGRSGMVGEFAYDHGSEAFDPPAAADRRRRGRGADEAPET